jgi:hypothetical protein
MPSLAWQTVFLIVLLLPGLFFLYGLYSREGFSRDTAPKNPMATLGAVILVSIVAQAVVSGGASLIRHPVDWARVLEALFVGPPNPSEAARNVASYYQEEPARIVIYVIESVAVAVLLGAWMGNLMRWGVVATPVQFSWAYQLRREEEDAAAGSVYYIHVLSNVENEGKNLLYRGRLIDFGLNADGTFSYIVLGATEQRFLDLTRSDPKVRDRVPIGAPHGIANEADLDEGAVPSELAARGSWRLDLRAWQSVIQPVAQWVYRRVRIQPPSAGGAMMIISGYNIRTVVYQAKFQVATAEAERQITSPEVEKEIERPVPTVPEEVLARRLEELEVQPIAGGSPAHSEEVLRGQGDPE